MLDRREIVHQNAKILLTVDVEDWFQVENFKKYIPFSTWSSYNSRVERNTLRLLDLFDSIRQVFVNGSTKKHVLRATFFMLGWIAERQPNLVKEIHDRGHEVASHGYNHQLCRNQPYAELKREIELSKSLLEDLIGSPVLGFRAPSFSLSPSLLELLEEHGYAYDSSFNSFGLNHRYGRLRVSHHAKKGVALELSRKFYEIPISNLQFGRCVVPLGGGGYFRTIPLPLFIRGVERTLQRNGAYVFYLHPWEIDPDQPRVADARLLTRFRHYYNLAGTMAKLTHLLVSCGEAEFLTCIQYLRSQTAPLGTSIVD